jgi:hypothetical protein
METVTLQGASALAVSPEGQKATMPVEKLLGKIAPLRMDTGDVLLPDGVVCVRSRGPITIWVYQMPPRVCNLKWIADDSPAHFGRGTRYRNVRIGLPYLVVLAVFAPGEHNRLQLSPYSECFFRTKPLASLDDDLLYPALLNCSKYPNHPQAGHPLAWICVQHLDRTRFVNEPDTGKRLRLGFSALMHCLLETGFNYSSEQHEGSSWFTESRRVDARVATVDKWQAATEKDPLFVLEVPWLKTGLSLRQVLDRIFGNLSAQQPAVATASDVARLIFNQTS